MDAEARQQKIEADLATLAAIDAESDVFSFEPHENGVGVYLFRFAGRGLGPIDVYGRPGLVSQHEVEVRLPLAYPDEPPDVRWLTPLLHPNLSLGGVVNLADLHLHWSPDMGLDVVCERLWDVARGAFFDLDHATCEAARPWYDAATPIALPMDDRPLRSLAEQPSNIVRYQRTGERWEWPVDGGIWFLNEENASNVSWPMPASRTSDNDVLYIGPES